MKKEKNVSMNEEISFKVFIPEKIPLFLFPAKLWTVVYSCRVIGSFDFCIAPVIVAHYKNTITVKSKVP